MAVPEPPQDAVVYMSAPNDEFSKVYLAIRTKERRVLTDDKAAQLPNTTSDQPHHKEWKRRKKSAQRFLNYLNAKDKPLEVLDLGCGNGWMSKLMGSLNGVRVEGVDLNPEELEQAHRTKASATVTYLHADIFQMAPHFISRFDVIVLNASVQYFADLKALIGQLNAFLNPKGEIHIIDSPFYRSSEIAGAKNRTLAYYRQMGFEQMAQWYFHHDWKLLPSHEVLYDPNQRSRLAQKWKPDSPFPWIRISAGAS